MLYHPADFFKVVAVGIVESCEALAVDIEDGDDSPCIKKGNDNL